MNRASAAARLERMTSTEFEAYRAERNRKQREKRAVDPEALPKHRMAVKRSRENREAELGREQVLAERAQRSRAWRKANPDQAAYHDRQKKLKNPAKWLVNKARQRAMISGMAHDIESEDIEPLPVYCPALGIELLYDLRKRTGQSPSLDRINNDLGYIKGNVIVVSSQANTMKSNGTVEQLGLLFDFYRRLSLAVS